MKQASRVTRFQDSQESAQEIIRDILKSKRDIDVNRLRIQEELVDLQKYLPQTDAGKQLFSDLKASLGRFKSELAEHDAVKSRDSDWEEERAEMQKRIDEVGGEVEKLRVPWIHRILGHLEVLKETGY